MLPVSSIQQTRAILRTTFVMSNTFETSLIQSYPAHLTGFEPTIWQPVSGNLRDKLLDRETLYTLLGVDVLTEQHRRTYNLSSRCRQPAKAGRFGRRWGRKESLILASNGVVRPQGGIAPSKPIISHRRRGIRCGNRKAFVPITAATSFRTREKMLPPPPPFPPYAALWP